MHADHTAAQTFGQILIATYFLAMLVKNISVWDFNIQRTGALLPCPAMVLIGGFAVQFSSATMLLLDFHASIGAFGLICFTLASTAMFHRFWTMDDPVIRNYHMLLLWNNVGMIGGLFLVA